MKPLTRQEFQMDLEELILQARPDIAIRDLRYTILRIEEDLYGKRGLADEPNTEDLEGYAGWAGGKEI